MILNRKLRQNYGNFSKQISEKWKIHLVIRYFKRLIRTHNLIDTNNRPL